MVHTLSFVSGFCTIFENFVVGFICYSFDCGFSISLSLKLSVPFHFLLSFPLCVLKTKIKNKKTKSGYDDVSNFMSHENEDIQKAARRVLGPERIDAAEGFDPLPLLCSYRTILAIP